MLICDEATSDEAWKQAVRAIESTTRIIPVGSVYTADYCDSEVVPKRVAQINFIKISGDSFENLREALLTPTVSPWLFWEARRVFNSRVPKLFADDRDLGILYSSELARIGDSFVLHKTGSPPKQLAVVHDQNYAFMACRGGNHMLDCSRANLEDGSLRFALTFGEGDATVYALGNSGTVFTLETETLLGAYDPQDREGTWERYVSMGEQIRSHLAAMGLDTRVAIY